MTTIYILFLFTISLSNKALGEPYDLYQQMKNLNASCFPLDSCKTTYSRSDHLWNKRKCECGSHCVRFGTCCADSIHTFEKIPPLLPEHEHCQNLEYFPTPVMMVSQCDPNWKWSSSIMQKCEESNYLSNDRLLTNIPVTNVKTLTTYKNYFCAVCNRGGKDFLFWRVGLNTKDSHQLAKNLMKDGKRYVLKNIKHNAQNKNWEFLDKSSGEKVGIKVRYMLPPYLRKMVKPCYINLVDKCKSSRSRSLIKQECQAYYSPIKIESEDKTVVYKNIHCVMCNNVDTSSVKINSCMRETTMREEEYRFSFAYLLDINTSTGNKVGMTQVLKPDCGENAVYDTAANKCRKLMCLPGTGRVLVNGKCVLQ